MNTSSLPVSRRQAVKTMLVAPFAPLALTELGIDTGFATKVANQIDTSLAKHGVTFFTPVAKQRLFDEVMEVFETQWQKITKGDSLPLEPNARPAFEKYALNMIDRYIPACLQEEEEQGRDVAWGYYLTGERAPKWTPTTPPRSKST